ncbi:hypothetical protein GCM10025857_03590 [Alicyclobacillus contaminans]|nr:hypothetical protein GCM10025857_03590 [Alicyclobacillus contaminans]
MSAMELPLKEPTAEGTTPAQLPSGVIRRVVVKSVSRVIEVQLMSWPELLSARAAGATEPDEQTVAKDVVTAVRTLRQLATSLHREAIALRVVPAPWEAPLADETAAALFAALVDWYGEEEPVVANWLANARITVEPKAAADGQPAIQRWHCWVANDAELGVLQKKRTDRWLTERLQDVFGLAVEYRFAVDAAAEERLNELKKTLEENERREVLDMLAQEEKSAAEKPAPPSENGGERPAFRRDRRREDDQPLPPLTLGRPIDAAQVIPIREIVDEMRKAVVEGRVFSVDKRTLPSGRTLIQFNITDDTSSITAKLFSNQERQLEALEPLKDDVYVRIQGQVQFDTYAKELVFMVQDMQPAQAPERVDQAEVKRVELHLHSNMSQLDGVTPVKRFVQQAAAWGHEAIAITDHGVVQAFPEAYAAGKKHGIKVLLGVEAYVVDDGTPVVYREADVALTDETEYVVFDTETTGLNAREDTLIEISGVRMRGKEIVDQFAALIDPERPIPPKISELTGITPDMLAGQPKLAEVLPEFRRFAEGAILVAHNAEFDVGFLGQCASRIGMEPWTQPVIDTLALARSLYPGEKNYRLKTLTQKFQVELINHHRAIADAEATAKVFAHMQDTLRERGLTRLPQLNGLSGDVDVSRVRPFHATLLVRNQTGLKNLYKLVSMAHTTYLHRVPRIPKSELVKHREGLLIGTACQQGELIQAFLRGKSMDEIESICEFYDYLELQPLSHYENLVREQMVQSLQSVKDIHRQVVELGAKLNKPVVATGDAHYLHPNDAIFREIYLQSQSQGEAVQQPPLYLRTTDEMLEEFAHLGDDAVRVVVDNTRYIAEQLEDVKPIPDQLFTPVIEGAEDEITRMSYERARALYGDPLPEIVEARLKKSSIPSSTTDLPSST